MPITQEEQVKIQYALGSMLRRLQDEGYIRKERLTELMERRTNLLLGEGFVTNAERQTKKEEEELLS